MPDDSTEMKDSVENRNATSHCLNWDNTAYSFELLLGSTTHLNKLWYSAITQKLWQSTSFVQLGRMNNWLYAIMTIFAHGSKFAVQNLRDDCAIRPNWLRAWPQWLMAVWFWSFCCNCKPVDSPCRSRKGKFGMVSKICNRQQIVFRSGVYKLFCPRAT